MSDAHEVCDRTIRWHEDQAKELQGRITELERQLAEEKAKANRVQKALLHGTPPEKLATYIDNLESHLSKVTAQLAERDALLGEAEETIAEAVRLYEGDGYGRHREARDLLDRIRASLEADHENS